SDTARGFFPGTRPARGSTPTGPLGHYASSAWLFTGLSRLTLMLSCRAGCDAFLPRMAERALYSLRPVFRQSQRSSPPGRATFFEISCPAFCSLVFFNPLEHVVDPRTKGWPPVSADSSSLQCILDRLRAGDLAVRNDLIRHSRERLRLLTRKM